MNHELSAQFKQTLSATGMVAILRGVRPDEVVAIGEALYAAGFRLIEVPLNSPEPLDSIRRLLAALPQDVIIGAGTVMSPAAVQEVYEVGGRLVVMPHADLAVVRAAHAAGMVVTPGVATPTEAFAALDAGADGLKAFPAEAMPPVVIKAWRAVVPKSVPLLPVGGIKPQSMQAYLEAGASGFGLGSALYRTGDDAATVGRNAEAFMTAWRALRQPA